MFQKIIQKTAINSATTSQVESKACVFYGFAPPTSNTTYTPNQFFDVCLPYYSRGCVRLVAYMIRKTLGWCDAYGNPQEDQIVISYNDLVQNAGISRSMISKAIDEAISARFIRCVRPGRPDSARQRSVSALYELRWHDATEYIKDPALFQGFYEGEGNRTDIPNEYFDVVIRNEALSVAKVVGSIIRFSIGFQARRGQRRQHVQLSFSDIQRYARIQSRQDLSQAISCALQQNYIARVQEGLFTPTKGHQITTTYSLRWSDKTLSILTGMKSVPEAIQDTGSKNVPENRFEKRTSIKMKPINETLKQQQPVIDDHAVVVEPLIIQILKDNGFSSKDAKELGSKYSPQQIQNQINWLERRNPSRNPAGMLRRAIEENWAEPIDVEVRTSELSNSPGFIFARHFYAGYAGNDSEPTAIPSANDLEHAGLYVERLLNVWPDKKRVPEWGRRFGTLVCGLAQGNQTRIVSCVAALRSFGDEFFKQHQRQRKDVERQAMKAAGAVHKKRFVHEYVLFLLSEEQRVKEEYPEVYGDFEKSRTQERGYIESSRFFTDEQRREQLAIFDAEQHRLKAFKEFFSDVLDFWQWDARFNTEPFNAAKVTV